MPVHTAAGSVGGTLADCVDRVSDGAARLLHFSDAGAVGRQKSWTSGPRVCVLRAIMGFSKEVGGFEAAVLLSFGSNELHSVLSSLMNLAESFVSDGNSVPLRMK